MGFVLHRLLRDHKWKTISNDTYNHVRVTVQECEVCGDRKLRTKELP